MQKIFADAFFRIVADFIFSSILLSIICMDISWIQIFWYMLKYKLFNESLSQFGCNLDDTLEIFHFYVVTFCMTQKAWFFIGVALRSAMLALTSLKLQRRLTCLSTVALCEGGWSRSLWSLVKTFRLRSTCLSRRNLRSRWRRMEFSPFLLRTRLWWTSCE